jgi:ATP-dependent Clp protease ATP-binding subunit ClpA
VAGYSSLANCSLEGATLGEDEEAKQTETAAAGAEDMTKSSSSSSSSATGAVQQPQQWSSSMVELASRVQDVVQLQPLTAAALTMILDRQLAVAVELALQHGVQLVIEDTARRWLVNRATAGAATAPFATTAAAGSSDGASLLGSLDGTATAVGGGISRGARPVEKLVRGQVLLPLAQVLLQLQEQRHQQQQELEVGDALSTNRGSADQSMSEVVTVCISWTGDEHRPLRLHVA